MNTAVTDVVPGGFGVIVVHERENGVAYGPVLIDGGKTIALLVAAGESPIIQGTGGNAGVRVEGAETVLYMEGLGLVVNEAFAWVDRSRIVQNTGGGVLAENGAELVLRNCFVGGGAADVDAIAFNDSTLDMLYTTAGGGSILVSLDPMPEVECSGVVLTNGSTEAEAGSLDAVGWFGGYAAGDFSLTITGADIFRDVALWQEGDPRPTPDYAGADVPQ